MCSAVGALHPTKEPAQHHSSRRQLLVVVLCQHNQAETLCWQCYAALHSTAEPHQMHSVHAAQCDHVVARASCGASLCRQGGHSVMSKPATTRLVKHAQFCKSLNIRPRQLNQSDTVIPHYHVTLLRWPVLCLSDEHTPRGAWVVCTQPVWCALYTAEPVSCHSRCPAEAANIWVSCVERD